MKSIYIRKTEPLGDIRRSSCGELDVGRLCGSVVRAVDRQSKDLGSNPSAVESVFFFHRKISNSSNILINYNRKFISLTFYTRTMNFNELNISNYKKCSFLSKMQDKRDSHACRACRVGRNHAFIRISGREWVVVKYGILRAKNR